MRFLVGKWDMRGQALPQADDLKSKYAAQETHRQRHLRIALLFTFRASAFMCDPSLLLAVQILSDLSSSSFL